MSRDQEHELTVVSNMLPQIEEHLHKITEQHKTVSNLKTPSSQVKKRGFDGQEYVELSYMRLIADEYFPGWSFEVISCGKKDDDEFEVHGKLSWYDCGVKRRGDMVASHPFQRSTKNPDQFVGGGNTRKAAVTNCHKKAFNTYMNIADDVYRNQVVDLTPEEKVLIKEKMLEAKFSESEIQRIELNVRKGVITQTDLPELLEWIEKGPKK
jgi:hypothetical protein